MTYEAIETSTEDGRPVELYEFARNGTYYRFTSADTDQVYLTNTYTAIAIERSSIGQSDQFEKSGISIEFARDDSFASAFLAYSPDNPTTLTIFREHLSDGDDEFITYWKGRVGSVSATGSRIRLECESVFSSLKRQGLRMKHERMCRHILYDANCTLTAATFEETATADTVSGVSITFTLDTPDAGKLVDYFLGGYVEDANGAKRFIKTQSSNVITISYPFEDLADTDPISLFPGCQHRFITDCTDKFSNNDNYGGHPYRPTNDGPFTGKSIV